MNLYARFPVVLPQHLRDAGSNAIATFFLCVSASMMSPTPGRLSEHAILAQAETIGLTPRQSMKVVRDLEAAGELRRVGSRRRPAYDLPNFARYGVELQTGPSAVASKRPVQDQPARRQVVSAEPDSDREVVVKRPVHDHPASRSSQKQAQARALKGEEEEKRESSKSSLSSSSDLTGKSAREVVPIGLSTMSPAEYLAWELEIAEAMRVYCPQDVEPLEEHGPPTLRSAELAPPVAVLEETPPPPLEEPAQELEGIRRITDPVAVLYAHDAAYQEAHGAPPPYANPDAVEAWAGQLVRLHGSREEAITFVRTRTAEARLTIAELLAESFGRESKNGQEGSALGPPSPPVSQVYGEALPVEETQALTERALSALEEGCAA